MNDKTPHRPSRAVYGVALALESIRMLDTEGVWWSNNGMQREWHLRVGVWSASGGDESHIRGTQEVQAVSSGTAVYVELSV